MLTEYNFHQSLEQIKSNYSSVMLNCITTWKP